MADTTPAFLQNRLVEEENSMVTVRSLGTVQRLHLGPVTSPAIAMKRHAASPLTRKPLVDIRSGCNRKMADRPGRCQRWNTSGCTPLSTPIYPSSQGDQVSVATPARLQASDPISTHSQNLEELPQHPDIPSD